MGSSANKGSRPSRPQIRQAARPRAGQRFEPVQELDLWPAAKALLSELPGAAEGVLAIRELHAPFGVPDLTAIVGSAAARKRRLQSGIAPLLNEIDAGIAAAAAIDQPLTAAQLAYRLRWNLTSVQRRLPHVIRTGAVLDIGSGRVLRAPEIAPLGSIIAIETKVKDWPRALRQGRTYALWANAYVLILDRVSPASIPPLRKSVRADHGGLVVDGDLILRPRPQPHRKARQLWASEHVIADLMS